MNDMKEAVHRDTDKFFREEVIVTVICKSKKVNPSSATNWFNDLYNIRYPFPEEHEIGSGTESITGNITCVPDPVGKSACTSDSLIDPSDNKCDTTQLCDECKDFQPLARGILTWLSVVRDSLFQFEMMNIEDEYMRCVEGDDYLERINILLDRIENVFFRLGDCKNNLKRKLNAAVNSLKTLEGKVHVHLNNAVLLMFDCTT